MIEDFLGSLIDTMVKMSICLLVLAPFGLWKLVEIIIWLYNYVMAM